MRNVPNVDFVVMDKDQKFSYYDGLDLNICKRFCVDGRVIVERHKVLRGFSLSVFWYGTFNKLICFSFMSNILWLHWCVTKEYGKKNVKVVYVGLQDS